MLLQSFTFQSFPLGSELSSAQLHHWQQEFGSSFVCDAILLGKQMSQWYSTLILNITSADSFWENSGTGFAAGLLFSGSAAAWHRRAAQVLKHTELPLQCAILPTNDLWACFQRHETGFWTFSVCKRAATRKIAKNGTIQRAGERSEGQHRMAGCDGRSLAMHSGNGQLPIEKRNPRAPLDMFCWFLFCSRC